MTTTNRHSGVRVGGLSEILENIGAARQRCHDDMNKLRRQMISDFFDANPKRRYYLSLPMAYEIYSDDRFSCGLVVAKRDYSSGYIFHAAVTVPESVIEFLNTRLVCPEIDKLACMVFELLAASQPRDYDNPHGRVFRGRGTKWKYDRGVGSNSSENGEGRAR